MTTVFVRDHLRAATEAATGGQCTVLYAEGGEPSFFFVLPKFAIEDIDPALGAGTHPAFIINGQEVPRLFIGQYKGAVVNGRLLSLPNTAPAVNLTLQGASNYARAAGAGWHLMTNAEWAAIALWCYKNGWLPSGNTYYGRNNYAAHETALRVNGGSPGVASGSGATMSASGPVSWRHNNQAFGIADLGGNLREWVSGVRLANGELQIFQNNDAAAYDGTFATAPGWKAVKLSNGSLVAPGTAGTVKMNSVAALPSEDEDMGAFEWVDTITNRLGAVDSNTDGHRNTMPFSAVSGPATLKIHALAAIGETLYMGYAQGRNYGTREFNRGACYYDATRAGMFAFHALEGPGVQHGYTGARVVKY